jgi:prepilin-type N-terminal cleavage/methylation domain-containing protein
MRRAQGFTLLELLISVALLAVVVVYLMQTFTVHHKTYTVVDQTTEVQQSLRAISEILERDLRHAGMMVPEQGAVCGVDLTNGADTLFVSDAFAVDPDMDTAANYGASVGAATVGGGTTVLNLGSLDVEGATPPRYAYDTDGNGVNDSDFQVGAGVIVTDPGDGAGGAACGFVTGVNAGSINVNMVSANAVGGVGASLVAIPAHAYQITPPADPNPFRLLRNGTVLTEGAEDLQVAYYFDDDGDGDPTTPPPGEYLGDGTAADYTNNSGLDESTLREVRVNMVVRTRVSDPETTQGQFQVTENRTAPGGVDGFRRRVHTATVRPRNVNR